MSTVVVGQRVAQAWDAYMEGKPENTIDDDYLLLRLLERNKKSFTGGGDNILGAFEYKFNTNFAWISDTDSLSTVKDDLFDQYTYPWRQAGDTVTQTTFEDAINRGESKKFDLLAGKLENMRMTCRSRLNSAFFTAQTGSAPLGLPDLIATSPSSGTVGGVNRAVHTFWRNQQTTSTGTNFDLLRGSMRTINAACSKGQGMGEPDSYMSTSTVVNGYEALLVANERITQKTDANANAGFKSTAFKFKMADVYWDRDCPSGTMFAFRNDNPRLTVQAGHYFKVYPSVDPANQLLEIYKLEIICQLISGNPRHLGVITSIT